MREKHGAFGKANHYERYNVPLRIGFSPAQDLEFREGRENGDGT